MSDFVVGIDPSPSMVHIARYHREGYVAAAPLPINAPAQDQQNVNGSIFRARDVAAKVEALVLAQGKPNLVVMSKLLTFDITKDPSCPRRAGLWWAIAAAFAEMGVPVAEVPPMVAESVVRDGGRTHMGKAGFAATKQQVMKLWRKKDGKPLSDSDTFRYYTVAQAAIGGLVLGWDVPNLPMTEDRLRVLQSKACDFPPTVSVPKSVSEWRERNSALKIGA